MTANTGRSNVIYSQFWLDNSAGTLTNLTAYTKTIGDFGLTYETTDVSALSDAVKNFTKGRPEAGLDITFNLDTVVSAHLAALSKTTPLTLDIRVGINHAWEAGEPVFGITSSATSGYVLTSQNVNVDAQEIKCHFDVFGPTAPDFATAAHT